MNKYTPVIGLEIHVELKTKSKMFCQCDADYFGKKPNSNTCPVCLGMPGALPVPNRTAVEWAIKIGHALNCTIDKNSKFDRKHYFYPDLPKAYQISQYDEPLAEHGWLEITNTKSQTTKKFGITRVHLEEDTGKLTHTGKDTLVDFNRSGVPLVEIVTEPDFDNSEDVKIFLEELHTIIRYLNVSDANMDEGSMRLEPNISMMIAHPTAPKGEGILRQLPNYKVEVKNINSFNFAKKAIDFELKRQAKILDSGETPKQETRGYDDKKGITFSQRSKEEAQDYRYFPEPDIPPMLFTEEELALIQKTLPELPQEKVIRYVKDFGLKYADSFILTRSNRIASYFEEVMKEFPKLMLTNDPKTINTKMVGSNFRNRSHYQIIANLMINKKIPTNLSPKDFAIKAVGASATFIADPDKLNTAISKVIQENKEQIEQYKKGKTGLLGFFIGQVMKEMKGQADAKVIKKQLESKLH